MRQHHFIKVIKNCIKHPKTLQRHEACCIKADPRFVYLHCRPLSAEARDDLNAGSTVLIFVRFRVAEGKLYQVAVETFRSNKNWTLRGSKCGHGPRSMLIPV